LKESNLEAYISGEKLMKVTRILRIIISAIILLFLIIIINKLYIWGNASVPKVNSSQTNFQFTGELLLTIKQTECQALYLNTLLFVPQIFVKTYQISSKIRNNLSAEQLQEIILAPANPTEKQFIEGDLAFAYWAEKIFVKTIIKNFIPKSGCNLPEGYLNYFDYRDLEELAESYKCETCEPYDIVFYQLEAIPKRFIKK
jgi:hypothetical protein